MTCCAQNIITFTETDSTTIPYYGEYGAEPNIDVLYFIDGTWQTGVFTSISRTPVSITVEHGGTATGVIKLS